MESLSTLSLTYRLYRENDLTGILVLWEKYSGWGAITERQFQEWYFNTPFGNSMIIVATGEDDEVLGQLIFFPACIRVGAETIKAYRVSSPIIHPDLRTQDFKKFDHPVFAMYRLGLEMARRDEFSLLYSFPSVGWLTGVKTLPNYGFPLTDLATFPCFSIALDDTTANYARENYDWRFTLIENFTEEYDVLWDDAVTQFPIQCGVVRNREWLTFKLSQHFVFEARMPDNKLVGYLAIRKSDGLMIDCLARTPDDLRLVYLAVIGYLRKSFSEGQVLPWKKPELKVIATPGLEKIFTGFPGKKIAYDFAFYCCDIGDVAGNELFASKNWYMMPYD
jgi:hypothetical protein